VVYAIFQYTEVGLKMRAVSDDKQLAAISGINVDKVINYTWIISASIAALSGIIYGMRVWWRRTYLLIYFCPCLLHCWL